MTSLDRIARALGSSQLELFAALEDQDHAPDQPDTSLVRADEGTRGRYGFGDGRLLVHGERRFTPLEYSASTVEMGEYVLHSEAEFLYLLEGQLDVDLAGRAVERLMPGDSFYFEGGIRHRWGSADGSPYRMLIVKEGAR